MNDWINIWKYLWRTRCQNGSRSSFSKFTFEFGEANWVLPLNQVKVKYKDIWHLLTEHSSISFPLRKFKQAFRGKKH